MGDGPVAAAETDSQADGRCGVAVCNKTQQTAGPLLREGDDIRVGLIPLAMAT